MNLPLFPIASVILFPKALLPLYIFEPRYKQMVEDLLQKPKDERLLVIAVMMDAQEHYFHVATVGKIVHYEKLEDGGYNILVLGLFKVHPKEVDSTRLYRQAKVEIIDEVHSHERDAKFKNIILNALHIHKYNAQINFPEFLTYSLHDILPQLCSGLPLTHSQRLALYAELSIERKVDLLVNFIKNVPLLTSYFPSDTDTLAMN